MRDWLSVVYDDSIVRPFQYADIAMELSKKQFPTAEICGINILVDAETEDEICVLVEGTIGQEDFNWDYGIKRQD